MTDLSEPLAILYEIYSTREAHSVKYNKLSQVLLPEVLEAAGKDEYFFLERLFSRIRFRVTADRYEFFRVFAQNRHFFSKKKILNLWLAIISDYRSPVYQTVLVRNNENLELPADLNLTPRLKELLNPDYKLIKLKAELSPAHKDLIRNMGLSDELLIDSRPVTRRYCQLGKPGWQFLRYCEGFRRQRRKQDIPERMRLAVQKDSFEFFNIFQDLCGLKLSYSLLDEILKANACSILRELLKTGQTQKVIPLEELAIACTVQFEDDKSVPLLRTIEEVFPGSLKDIQDHWGRNLLWYAALNPNTVFYHPYCKLSEYLLAAGCDPDNENQLDLSWRFVVKNIPSKNKELFLKHRTLFSSSLLSTQPAADIAAESDWLNNL